MRRKATPILSEYYNIGDGWLVMAEAMDMIEQGYDKILIVHPFGCLVSHVAERGVLKKLRQLYISMRYYTMADVWNRYTTGTWYNDNAHVVRAAYSRWRRAATVASQ